jgi:hypothetical protein
MADSQHWQARSSLIQFMTTTAWRASPAGQRPPGDRIPAHHPGALRCRCVLTKPKASKATKAAGPQQVFEHPDLDHMFLFRAYKRRDKVTEADLIEIPKFLDEKGVVNPAVIEELLHQPSA